MKPHHPIVELLNAVEGWIRKRQEAPRICHTFKKQVLPISALTDGWVSSPATVNETCHKAEVPRFPEKHMVNHFGHPKPFWIPLQNKQYVTHFSPSLSMDYSCTVKQPVATTQTQRTPRKTLNCLRYPELKEALYSEKSNEQQAPWPLPPCPGSLSWTCAQNHIYLGQAVRGDLGCLLSNGMRASVTASC